MTNPFEEISEQLEELKQIVLEIRNNPPSQVEPDDQLMTVIEAANFLSLKVPTIYSKTSKGELPVLKRGKRIYFTRKMLMDFLTDGNNKTDEY